MSGKSNIDSSDSFDYEKWALDTKQKELWASFVNGASLADERISEACANLRVLYGKVTAETVRGHLDFAIRSRKGDFGVISSCFRPYCGLLSFLYCDINLRFIIRYSSLDSDYLFLTWDNDRSDEENLKPIYTSIENLLGNFQHLLRELRAGPEKIALKDALLSILHKNYVDYSLWQPASEKLRCARELGTPANIDPDEWV
jgi:hypothetical protein